MKVRTFNRVFTVLVILWLGYSIVCAIVCAGLEKTGHMPACVIVWIVVSLLFIVWMLICGAVKDKKKVYHLKDNDDPCANCAYLYNADDCHNYGCIYNRES